MACWGVLLLALLAWGLPAALVTTRANSRATVIRRALWFGLAIGSALVLTLSLLLPLASPAASVILAGTAAISGVVGWWLFAQRRWRTSIRTRGLRLLTVFVAALVVVQLVLAFAVLGPVTNYDSGLYHLGAIAYGSDFSLVPGLSNLYGPLGYATLEFAWGSALAGTPLLDNGFRLLNGFLMLLVSTELALRLRSLRRVGDYVLLVAVIAMWGPMLGMADFWIASPTQDAAALVLTLALTAYFVDAVSGRTGWINDAWMAVLIGTLVVAVRTTMIVYVASALAVLALVAIRRRSRVTHRLGTPVIVGALSAVVGITMLLRDVILSGWLLYPLSFLPMGVPWRAPDPQGLRDATLGFHRDPSNISGALVGWDWIPGWISRLPDYWESYLVAGFALALIVALVVTGRRGSKVPVRRIVVSTAPAVVAVFVWFVASPPTFRFIWGPLVMMFAIPIGWLIHSLRYASTSRRHDVARTALLGTGVALLVVPGLLTVTVRIPWTEYTQQTAMPGPIPLTYVLAPLPSPETSVVSLPSGLEIRRPVPTDQCWSVYPLCSPDFPESLEPRGAWIGAGFQR